MMKREKKWIVIWMIALCLVVPSHAFSLGKDIPLKAKGDIRNQIETSLGGSAAKGIPLLDTWINWDDPQQWPKELTFHNTKLILDVSAPGMLKTIGAPVSPPKEIPRSFPLSLTYGVQGTPGDVYPLPMCDWRKDGSVSSKQVVLMHGRNGTVLFLLRFYGTGELMYHSRTDVKSGDSTTDYFEKNGWLAGTLIHSVAEGRPIYREKGAEKNLNAYNAMIDRLNQSNPGDDTPLPQLGVGEARVSPTAQKVRINSPSN